ncbi:MAG: YigZ family protein [Cytophagales bacterium]|nr:YigZ family protein [Cytophagales bacterium]
MSVEQYQTIEKISEGVYKEKGSKFFAYAYPVQTEEEIREIVKGLRKEYYDARHHCFAFMLGADQKRFRANDDGEPSNSAGNPILGQICSHNLTDILIVVVRYFGGTKLGVAGLINAYRSSALDAIEQATIITKDVTESVKIGFDYFAMNDVMKVIKDYNPEVLHQSFDNTCEMTLSLKIGMAEEVKGKLEKWILE